MRTKKEATAALEAMREAAETERTYDYVTDLKELRRQYGKRTAAQYRHLLDDCVRKYEEFEGADVHAALVAKCKTGDVEAIKLYREMQSCSANGNGVTIIDDL